MGDAVGDGDELVRLGEIEIVEHALFEDVRVDLAHAVYAVAHGDAEVGHVHAAVADHGHAAYTLPLAGEELPQPGAFAAVDLLKDHVDAGQETGHHFFRPLFKRLRHHGVVGIGEGPAGDVFGLAPAQIVIVDQYAHEFGDCHAGMGVVHVQGNLVREDIKVPAIHPDKVPYGVLHGRAGKEILLL